MKKANDDIELANKTIQKFYTGLEGKIPKAVDKLKKQSKHLDEQNQELKVVNEKLVKSKADIENLEKNKVATLESKRELELRKEAINKELKEIILKYGITESIQIEIEKVNKTQNELNTLEEYLVNQENNLVSYSKKKSEALEELSKNKISIATFEATIFELQQNIEDIEKDIENILVTSGFDRSVFDNMGNYDFTTLENSVKDYKDQVVINQNKLQEYIFYKDLDFESLSNELLSVTTELQKIEEQIKVNFEDRGSIEEKLKNFDKMLEEKASVESSLKDITKRYNDISSLKELLQGKRFVEFIARQDLEEVVYFASKEFSKLSNGKYNLKLSEQNLDIEVIDNLQGGKCRGIKTLSGGETFIISLCLALSLSKKIQMKKNSVIEFFFLDEGFGSLDNEALDRVIDTLTSLKNSNINIGIITHVDRLKERVPKTLIVENGVQGTVVRID